MIAGLDLETTGIDFASGHKIIEVAIGLYDFDGVERGIFVQRYNPQRPIDAKAQAVHGISFEDVSTAPLFARDADKLSGLLNRCHGIVAHNGREFDLPFINTEFRAAGVPQVTAPLLIDTMEARWATAFGKVPNLGELCFACGVPYDPTQAHGAAYDVRVMMRCYFHALKKGFFPAVPFRSEYKEAA